MKLVSLAPRFVGDFEKGIDFKGDHGLLEQSLVDHSAIAEMLGPYKPESPFGFRQDLDVHRIRASHERSLPCENGRD